jgi:TPR repeat protein
VRRWVMIGTVAATSVTAISPGCTQPRSEAGPAPSAEACIADLISDLRLLTVSSSCAADDSVCSAKCVAGDAASCLAMAYAAEKDSGTGEEAVRLYHRACLLGSASACTNYAAGIWAGEHSDDQLACARRTFEKACAAKEPFACGMVGRLMLESTSPPAFAEGRRYLEAACDRVSGFPCRVLAKHLESGKLGDYPPELIRTLLTRACEGGDPDACGEPKTASETFH